MVQKYGHMANQAVNETFPCVVCEDQEPTFSWTDYHGEGYCVKCGTPYQLSGGNEGDVLPKINIKKEFIPVLQRYFKETGLGNGCGSFMIVRDYPDQIEDKTKFDEWMSEHKGEFSHLFKKEEKSNGQKV